MYNNIMQQIPHMYIPGLIHRKEKHKFIINFEDYFDKLLYQVIALFDVNLY